MLKKLRRRANKVYFKFMVLNLLIAFVCLWISGFGIIDYYKGPQTIVAQSLEQYEKQYVKMQVKYPLEVYEEEYVEHKLTKARVTTKLSYVVYSENNNEFFGIRLDSKSQEEMETRINAAWDYILEYTDEDVSNPMEIVGTVKKMDSKDLGYFNEVLDYIEVDQCTTAYYIDVNHIKNFTATGLIVDFVLAVIFVIFAFLCLLGIVTGRYKKGIEDYLKENQGQSMNSLTEEFEKAQPVAGRVWISEKCIFTTGLFGSVIWNTKDCVWAYSDTLKWSSIPIHTGILIGDKNHKMRGISASKKIAEMVMACFKIKAPHVLLGYYKEWEKLYNNDMPEFLNIKYNQVMAEEEKKMQAEYNTDMFDAMWKNYEQ